MQNTQAGSTARITLIILAVIGIGLAISAALLPKGFGNDMAQIGQGSNIALLAHNKESVQSLTLMDYLSEIRSDYLGNVVFLVADMSDPKGKAFVDKEQVKSGDLLLFSPNGTRLRVIENIKDVETLRMALNNTF